MKLGLVQKRSAAGALALVTMAAVGSGCAWREHTRPLRDDDRLVLESMVVRLPTAPGWRVSRQFESGRRTFKLEHTATDGTADAWINVIEADGALPISPREPVRAALAGWVPTLIEDPAAEVADLATAADPRFGPAVEVGLRATESEAHAGILVKRVAWTFQLTWASPAAPARTCLVEYSVRSDRAAGPVPAEERWRELLAGIELRSADAGHVKEAARADDFPKQMESGLARRSLTLPRGAVQWSLWRQRWVDRGGFDGSWGLRAGLTDRLELAAPGFLRYSFGEVEALRRPEYAIGVGWNHFTHDAIAGSTWGFGLTAQSRRRLAPDLSANVDLLLEWLHESRTGRDRGAGKAAAGISWEPHSLVSVGLEAGYDGTTWVGGLLRPLVTVHVAPLDLGLDAAAVWDGRELGVLAGFSLRLTL